MAWKNVYIFPRRVTINTNLCIFILVKNTNFREHLQHSFQNVLIISPIPPQSAFFGLTDNKISYHLIKHILLIFKYYVYETIEDGSLDLKVFFKKTLICVENIERQIKLK